MKKGGPEIRTVAVVLVMLVGHGKEIHKIVLVLIFFFIMKKINYIHKCSKHQSYVHIRRMGWVTSLSPIWKWWLMWQWDKHTRVLEDLRFVCKLPLPLVTSKDACIRKNRCVFAGSCVCAALHACAMHCVKGLIELHLKLKCCTPEHAYGNIRVKGP